RLTAGDQFQRTRHVALAIDSGKDENGGFHGGSGWKTGIGADRRRGRDNQLTGVFPVLASLKCSASGQGSITSLGIETMNVVPLATSATDPITSEGVVAA